MFRVGGRFPSECQSKKIGEEETDRRTDQQTYNSAYAKPGITRVNTSENTPEKREQAPAYERERVVQKAENLSHGRTVLHSIADRNGVPRRTHDQNPFICAI
jgi:xanthine dehydrogenase molybdopterin-binding subunit B